MRERVRNPVIALIGVLVLALLVVAGLRLWDRMHRTELDDAIDRVPRATLRLAFTDWEQIRERTGVKQTSAPTAAEIKRLTDRGYDSDLTGVSSIDESTAALQENFGFSGTTMQWEALAQSRTGATMVARMPDGFDFDQVRRKLKDLGFTAPKEKDGVWKGGIDLVASIDPSISPELQYVALLDDEHLIVTSDGVEYAGTAAAVARGDAPSLSDIGSVRGVAHASGNPAAAMLWSRDFACEDLSMSTADPDSQDQAESLIAAAGKTNPLNGLVMSLDEDRTFRVVLGFESADQARDNLTSRARLAVGEAVGRGGNFSDDLKLTSSRTDGSRVLLAFRPKQRSGFVLSALNSGPVLFASC